ncbi:tyrosine-type recombinase/integrase [Enterococcus sp. BWB1-3]|uniref:tyrosine-type recombinase/integrase n=1 Tax=Enterococcus sp. BWB1-3 TaxID=2787713 RepID=UPI00192506A9|nr:tyrosine-type recombinase/integrase [Enterococcus sp. BWB1-3]MBL1228016.1 tyrosine-type recombinase/integrase [Enterococcus sp. BWB1-3]
MSVSSYEVKRGVRWRFVISRRDPLSKKRIDICRGGFRTKSDARLAEARYRDDMEELATVKLGYDSTVDEVFEYWLELTKKRDVKEQSIIGYERRYKTGFKNKLGSKKIRKVNSVTMQEIIDDLTPRYTNMNNQVSMIKSIFELAKNAGIIRLNPVDIVVVQKSKLKKKKKEEDKYLTAIELNQFFKGMEERNKTKAQNKNSHNLQYKTLFTLLVMTGIRIGEALALNWSDINLKEKTLTINKTQVELKRRIEVSSPKTIDSNRIIPISSEYLLELLKKWKVSQKEAEEKFNREINEYSEVVFYNIAQEKRYTNSAINYKLEVICEAMKREKFTAHAFRHTFITLLTEYETTKNKLSKYVGHTLKDKTMTDGYTHTSPNYLVEIANKADEVIVPLIQVG